MAIKGVCAIDFNEFTLDKGATNPNSFSTSGRKSVSISSSHKRNKTDKMNEMYDQQRLKREKKPGNKQRKQILQQLETSGIMIAPSKAKKKQVKEGSTQPKATKKRRARSRRSTAFGGETGTKKQRKASGSTRVSYNGPSSSSRTYSDGGSNTIY